MILLQGTLAMNYKPLYMNNVKTGEHLEFVNVARECDCLEVYVTE